MGLLPLKMVNYTIEVQKSRFTWFILKQSSELIYLHPFSS